ncbi:hypothetical protein [Mycobacteroides abscessus]|uniref:hypothetical protein n=1 Tax=Mycobacteroides abscessus TaxID=36809 RepID=UPI001926357A|nr:hypothetical protein [Mycobacteroides abscessus]MBL3752258.1 hypothetical protein [Mycobacteroides abscessus subsp. massiliense]
MSENGFAPPKPWRSVSARYLRRVVDDIVNNIGASDDVDDLGTPTGAAVSQRQVMCWRARILLW